MLFRMEVTHAQFRAFHNSVKFCNDILDDGLTLKKLTTFEFDAVSPPSILPKPLHYSTYLLQLHTPRFTHGLFTDIIYALLDLIDDIVNKNIFSLSNIKNGVKILVLSGTASTTN